jgi:hypothetical protein
MIWSKKYGFGFCVVLISLLSSCDARLTRDEYRDWIRDYENRLHVVSSNSDIVFDLQFLPAPYLAMQRGYDRMGEDSMKRAVNTLSQMQHYVLTISTKTQQDILKYGAQTPGDIQERQYYLSYLLQDAISLEENGKTYPCLLYHFEKSQTSNGGRTFILAFDNPQPASDESRVVIRSEYFGSLPVSISVRKSNIPQVKL